VVITPLFDIPLWRSNIVIRSPRDEAVVKVVRWKGGGSWTAAAWGLWFPAFLMYVIYSPSSLRFEDILNPLLLYYMHLAIVFVAWSSAWRTREGDELKYSFYRYCYHDTYTKLRTLEESSISATVFLDALAKRGGLVLKSEFDPVHFDKKFFEYANKGRRGSYVAKVWTKSLDDSRKRIDPYARTTYPSSKFAMIVATITPFIIRVVEGREVFGNDAPSVIANLFLAILSVWEWWCLCEAFARPAITEVTDIRDLISIFLDSTLNYHLRVLKAKNFFYDPDETRVFLNRDLTIDLTDHHNIVSFFTAYKLLGHWAKINIRGLERMLQALLLIQFTITFAFLGVSFLSPQSITLNIMSYVLLESGFCLFVILQALRACVKVNDADKLVRMKCIELCTLLDFEDEEEGTEKSTARAFNGIATYLDRARVVQARVFGIYLSRELVAKVMISFLAATASALLRSGIA